MKVGVLATHPIQYDCPWYRELAKVVDLHVFFAHRETREAHAAAGFNVEFDWDVPLLDGFRSTFLENVASRPNVSTFWGCNTPEITKIIRHGGFDAFIVHGWSTQSFWQAMRACWRTGTPIMVRGDSSLGVPRAWWWRVAKRPAFRAFISRFDAYLIVGSRAREYLLHYGADPARCFDAPHCVDNAFFRSAAAACRPERDALRRRWGLPPDAIVFLFAGRFVDHKRPEKFVDAIATAAARRPGIAGLMVGDGPMRQQVEERVARIGAPITFAGFLNQSEIARAYVAADALVVPSTWETWGLIVNEAMACGLPAVVTEGVACAHDLVVPGLSGEVYGVDDTQGLVGIIDRLAADPGYSAALSRGALAQVEKFDISAAVAGTMTAIETTRATARRHHA